MIAFINFSAGIINRISGKRHDEDFLEEFCQRNYNLPVDSVVEVLLRTGKLPKSCNPDYRRVVRCCKLTHTIRGAFSELFKGSYTSTVGVVLEDNIIMTYVTADKKRTLHALQTDTLTVNMLADGKPDSFLVKNVVRSNIEVLADCVEKAAVQLARRKVVLS